MASIDNAASELVTIDVVLGQTAILLTGIGSVVPQAAAASLAIGMLIALNKLAQRLVNGERVPALPTYTDALMEYLKANPWPTEPTTAPEGA